jgi:hypothetical protein
MLGGLMMLSGWVGTQMYASPAPATGMAPPEAAELEACFPADEEQAYSPIRDDETARWVLAMFGAMDGERDKPAVAVDSSHRFAFGP